MASIINKLTNFFSSPPMTPEQKEIKGLKKEIEKVQKAIQDNLLKAQGLQENYKDKLILEVDLKKRMPQLRKEKADLKTKLSGLKEELEERLAGLNSLQ